MLKSRLLGAVGIVAVVGGVLAAQTPLAFEVASIKQASFPSEANFQGTVAAGTCGNLKIPIAGNRVSLPRVTLCGLLRLAYGVRDYQIIGVPAGMTKPDRTNYYALDARAASGTTLSDDLARQMLRTLLEDRFRLTFHHESREASVYALVVAKNGPKFAANSQELVFKGQQMCRDNATFAFGPGLFVNCSLDIRPNPVASMAALAQRLNDQTDRPVVDKTGLTGQYLFMLQWTPDGAPSGPDAPPSIFTAIQDQLGLKLDPQRLTVDALVIDRAERPTPN